MQLKTLRLDAPVPNLFWISEGRAYYNSASSEQAARVVRFLEELLPVSVAEFSGAMTVEECFLVHGLDIVSVRQVGGVVIGNVKLWSKRVRGFLEN